MDCPSQRTEPLALEDFGKETRVLNLWAENNPKFIPLSRKKTSLSHKQELINVFLLPELLIFAQTRRLGEEIAKFASTWHQENRTFR